MTLPLAGTLPFFERKLRIPRGLALLLAVLAATLLHGLHPGKGRIDGADSAQYLAAAYHLKTHGIFSESYSAAKPMPEVGREPGYPLLLSLVMRIDPAFAAYDPDCLMAEAGCGARTYRSVILLNGLFIGLSGLFVYWLVGLLGGPALARWLGGAHIWLNFQGAGEAGYVMSDYLALFLEALLAFLLIRTIRKGRIANWAAAGTALGALCLVKGVYVYFALPLLAVLLGLLAVRDEWRKALGGVLVLSFCFALPVGGWMARNASLGAGWVVSAGRTEIALSTREVFDHMSPGQYLGAFLYWTRGFGDDLARALLPAADWQPFELYRPDGFYMVGQTRTEPMVLDLMKREGVGSAEAEKRVTADMLARIAHRPFGYILSTAPLFWRGIWMDEFIVASLPALIWLCARAWRRRRFLVLAALSPALFSLLFYPLTSLNVPRYQVTALPGLALAFGFGMAALIGWTQEFRRAARPG